MTIFRSDFVDFSEWDAMNTFFADLLTFGSDIIEFMPYLHI